MPGTGVPSPRRCRSRGSPAQPAGTTTSQRLLLRGEGACLGGHAAGWSPAPLSPVPHGRSSVQANLAQAGHFSGNGEERARLGGFDLLL